MRRHAIKLPILTIAIGQNASIAISLAAGVNSKVALGTLVDLIVYAPTTLPETVECQASWIESPTASDWRTLSIAGTDVTAPADRAAVVPAAAMKAFRLRATTPVGAD